MSTQVKGLVGKRMLGKNLISAVGSWNGIE